MLVLAGMRIYLTSGVAALLMVARQLTTQHLPFSVRIIDFSAEEEGLLGSNYYVRSLSDEDRQRIMAMINLDVVGADISLAVEGDAHLVAQAHSVAQRLN